MTSCEAKTDEHLQAAFGAMLSGDFTPEEFRVANRHLGACAACRQEYGTLAAFHTRMRDAYGVTEARGSRLGSRGRVWGGLALAASLLVGVAVWQAAPDSAVMTASPQAVGVTTVASNAEVGSFVPTTADPVAAATDRPEQTDAVTISAADDMDVNLDEITDEELDQILFELGV